MDKGILEKRIQKLIKLGKEKEVKVVIENVGIGKNILYNQEEYIELIKKYNFDSLIDIGHAIANNWDLDKVITELKENIIAYHFHITMERKIFISLYMMGKQIMRELFHL